jgi:D-glycero-alpha-D-manno-heptose 1-phosphate guanylyltransferase
MTDEAIILAGGFGTRLQSAVPDLPKPLAPVQGRPFVAWVLDSLERQGIRRVILATGYKAGVVCEVLGRRWGHMELEYAVEVSPLGTGGAMANAAKHMEGDSVLVLNGDTYLEMDYRAFSAEMHRLGARIGIALVEVPEVARYGAVRVQGTHVVGFNEKGGGGPGWINAGVYWLMRTVWESVDATRACSFEREILTVEASRGNVCAYTATHGFIDIGIPDDYQRAQSWNFSATHVGSRLETESVARN